MIHYKPRPKKDKTGEQEKVRYYGTPMGSQFVTEEKLAKEICERCSLTEPDVIAALMALSESVQMCLERGETVRLKGLGSFYLSATSDGFDTPEECTPSQMRVRRICFKADNLLRRAMAKVKFQKRG